MNDRFYTRERIIRPDWPFLYYSRVIRLDELGQTFVVRLVRVAQDALRVVLRNTS